MWGDTLYNLPNLLSISGFYSAFSPGVVQIPCLPWFTFIPPFGVWGSKNRYRLLCSPALKSSHLPRWDQAQTAWSLIQGVCLQELQLQNDFSYVAIQKQMAQLNGKSFISNKQASMWHFLFP